MATLAPVGFQVRSSPGKGRGAFATSDLSTGSLVLMEIKTIDIFQMNAILNHRGTLPMHLQDQLSDLQIAADSQATHEHFDLFNKHFPIPASTVAADSKTHTRNRALPILLFYGY
ncbi:hypothetical protein Micbo1qcDRAFT_180348 [Microdochium bolleyi]|uniref:SET domain-containing protein n=1 Tax=Microdochium bolleyi TaxID=196109 RepID=A0A136ILV9_9PEZI|nr:hypothetical protein Micbo1qcDRAFT_180348 [Microdochium bolleyi]